MGRTMNQRIAYVDILKGFAIMAVVFFHVKCQLPEAKLFNPTVLGSMWHVPLFFMLSGFFVTERKILDTKSFLYSKFKRLYLKGLYYFVPVAILHNLFIKWDWYREGVSYGGEFVSVLSISENSFLVIRQFLLISREPIVGAMWFIDSLFLAMIGLAILVRLQKTLNVREGYLTIIILIMVVLSNLFTKKYGITLPKISNSITAMGLVYLGSQMFQRGYLKYVGKKTAIISGIILWSLSLVDCNVGLNTNGYSSIVQLVSITVTAFFTLAFVAKKIEKNYIGRILTMVGEYSFAIMGLHFVGFKVCSLVLSILSGKDYATYYLTTPDVESNYILVLLYFVFGIVIPLAIVRPIEVLFAHK